MRKSQTSVKLDEHQKVILMNFITRFLPKRGSQRKNNANEIGYLADSLDQVFRQYFGFGLDREAVFGTFEELGYESFYKKGAFDGKDFLPSVTGKYVNDNDVYADNDAMFIYVDVKAPQVTDLRLTTFLDEKMGEKKIKRIKQIISDIESFKVDFGLE